LARASGVAFRAGMDVPTADVPYARGRLLECLM
jgi:hypothetical protein